MTDDEQRQITTEVLQEHKEVRARLGCLRSKARRMARLFRGLADALDAPSPGGNIEKLIAQLPSKTNIESILGETEATEREIAVLESEMDAQGFAEYIPDKSGRVMPASDDD